MSFDGLNFSEMCTVLAESLNVLADMSNRHDLEWDFGEENEFVDMRWADWSTTEANNAMRDINIVAADITNTRNDLRGFAELEQRPSVARPIQGFSAFFAGTHSCESCENISKLTKFSELADSCKLYNVILSSVKRHNQLLNDIRIFIELPSIVDEDIPRLLVAAGPTAAELDQRKTPILPEAGSEYHLLLLDMWLRKCDNHHGHFDSIVTLPTRVVEVEHPEGPDFVRIRETNGLAQGRYIALSHRWRDDTLSSATIKSNLNDRRKAIRLNDLPQTFQDAIYIARKLHIRFIWIDSLCILQDHDGDWNVEAARVGNVYTSAYLTIAATAAADGLFSRTGKGSSIHEVASLSVSAEDFERDLEMGELNERGWVMQERCLSRRTIHFTAMQTYWECESAIWCETTNREIGPSKQYLGPNLSNTISCLPLADARHSVHELFAKYSGLKLTRGTDRPMAIFGLELKLALARKSGSFYGILEEFFPLGLFWQRSGERLMQPIVGFDRHPSSWTIREMSVPSWSWMAYDGEISYATISEDSFRKENDLRLTVAQFLDWKPKVLAAPMKRISGHCRIEPYGTTNHEVKDKFNNVVGWARYDYEYEFDIGTLACLSIGRGTADCDKGLAKVVNYVLLAKPVPLGGDIRNMYRRLGIAAICSEYVSDEIDNREGLVL